MGNSTTKKTAPPVRTIITSGKYDDPLSKIVTLRKIPVQTIAVAIFVGP